MAFKIEPLPCGETTVRDLQTGECMHSTIGPWLEANRLYIQQSQLSRRLMEPESESEPLVIYDVGLGIGANAVASLEAYAELNPKRGLHIVSFENDLSGIEFVLSHAEKFPYIQKREDLLKTLLSKHSVEDRSKPAPFQWTLKVGNFQDHALSTPAPELIFFDLYSSKTRPTEWGVSSFEILFKSAALRRQNDLSTLLFTYSASTPVRTALMLAGFYVGYGFSTGMKRETTVASVRKPDLQNPLGEEWLRRWKRSEKPIPGDCLHLSRDHIEKVLTERITKQNCSVSTLVTEGA